MNQSQGISKSKYYKKITKYWYLSDETGKKRNNKRDFKRKEKSEFKKLQQKGGL